MYVFKVYPTILSYVDPNGPWGVAIVEVQEELGANDLGTNDSAIKAGLTFDIYPMPKQPTI